MPNTYRYQVVHKSANLLAGRGDMSYDAALIAVVGEMQLPSATAVRILNDHTEEVVFHAERNSRGEWHPV